jgi:hypothetical protein
MQGASQYTLYIEDVRGIQSSLMMGMKVVAETLVSSDHFMQLMAGEDFTVIYWLFWELG